MTNQYEVRDVNRVRRVAKRAVYDRDQVHAVIDAALIGHVAIGPPETGITVIPMFHARMDDAILFHGARSSRLMKYLGSGQKVSISFAMVDGLVLAKSLFHHSMNYRSAVVFGSGEVIADPAGRLAALKVMSDKILPGRWEEARQPNARELAATEVVRIPIETASAKIRRGGPVDDQEDHDLPVWSGVLPVASAYGQLIPDDHSRSLPAADYLQAVVGKSLPR